MKDISLAKILQDVSALIGSLLPIAQLFFSQWVYAFDHVFLAKEQFVGISIITLIVSYIFIIAYLAKPYGELILPGQHRKHRKLQKYWSEYNKLQSNVNAAATASVFNQRTFENALKQFQDLKQPDAPRKINQDNHVSISVTFVVVCALIFVVLGFISNGGWIIASTQAVAYILLITFAALMLTIYKKINDNGTKWAENNRTRTDRAIKLAIDANGFGDLPQVTFVSQNSVGDFGSEFHVRTEYKGDIYDIVTDREAEYLVSITKLVNQPEVLT